MLYWGSLLILLAYLTYHLFVPPLLRGKNNLHEFVSSITAAHDSTVVMVTLLMIRKYLRRIPIDNIVQGYPRQRGEQLLEFTKRTRLSSELSDSDYTHGVPRALAFYYNWQNFERPIPRYLIFAVGFIGSVLVLLPAVDLFCRIVGSAIERIP